MNELEQKTREIRALIVKSIGTLGVGHIGGSLSVAELLAVLYFGVMKIDSKRPDMEGRDRLVLSKGHAGPALYAALALRGFFPEKWLDTLNCPGTQLPSHADMLRTPGVDMTTGSLGQGLSCAVGIAKGAKICGGHETVYAIVGDGECQEGLVWEAAIAAAHFKLDNLMVFVDHNKMQIDGMVEEVMGLQSLVRKFEAFGFDARETNGHDTECIMAAIAEAKKNTGRPHAFILHTVKGKGASFAEEAGVASHNMPVSEEQMRAALEELR